MQMAERSRPWLQGIVDTVVGARYLRQSTISHRNRLVVILLDSALETGCRAYLRHEKGIKLDSTHRHRENLMSVTRSKLKEIDEDVWGNLDFYYGEIRNDFYHDSASKTLTETAILDYEETVLFVLDRAFGVRFSALVESALATAAPSVGPPPPTEVDWSSLTSRTDRVLAAVLAVGPRTGDEVNRFFKKEGVPLRLKDGEFTSIVARNSGSKNLFYFDKDQKRWLLSSSGRFKLASLQKKDEDD